MKNQYLGAKHLSNKSVGDLQRQNNFYVEIAGLPKEVCFLIKGLSIPSSENEVLTIKYGNSQIKLPGAASFSDTELTINDSIDLDTEKTVAEWRKQVYDPQTEAMGRSVDFKKDGTITQFSPDGTIARQWKMEGVWPSKFTPGDLSNDGSDVKTIAVTLQVDRLYRLDKISD